MILVALLFLGINAIKEALRDFYKFTMLMYFLKENHYIILNHPPTIFEKSHSEPVRPRSFIPL
jgi:hypothetical protein